jgi:hypothetical protein
LHEGVLSLAVPHLAYFNFSIYAMPIHIEKITEYNTKTNNKVGKSGPRTTHVAV